jgi:hypothetical protein
MHIFEHQGHSTKMSFYSGILYAIFFDCGVSHVHLFSSPCPGKFRVSRSLKSNEHKWKGFLCDVPFLQKIKIAKSVFGSHENSNSQIWIIGHCASALTLLTHRYQHKNRESMMSLESCLQLTAKILVQWVISADVTLVICMDLAISYATHLWHWFVSALAAVHWWWPFTPIFAIIDIWYHQMGGEVKWLIVWGVTIPWEIMLCSWLFQFAELQGHDGLDDLPFSLSNSTFHDFKLCCGSTWILFKSVF